MSKASSTVNDKSIRQDISDMGSSTRYHSVDEEEKHSEQMITNDRYVWPIIESRHDTDIAAKMV